jgi:hypothetical protein
MKKGVLRQVVVLLATLATITVNALANIAPFNGQTTGEISDRFPVFFVPAGYVFSIWGLIYLGLLAFATYQALPARMDDERLGAIAPWYVLGCVANAVWIVLWHYEYLTLTVPVMLVLLVSLIAIYLRLGIGRRRVTLAQQLAVHLPFSIYLGWITVATVANVTDLLSSLGWSGWGISGQTWAGIMLFVAAAITYAVNLARADVGFVLVIVWAFVGIGVKQASVPSVALAARSLALVVALPLIYTVPRMRRRLLKTG